MPIILLILIIFAWVFIAGWNDLRDTEKLADILSGKTLLEKPVKQKKFWQKGFFWFGIIGIIGIILLLFD